MTPTEKTVTPDNPEKPSEEPDTPTQETENKTEQDNNKTNNPKTGDNIVTNVILFVTSIAAIGALTIAKRKNQKDNTTKYREAG